jgi:cell division protein FtsN
VADGIGSGSHEVHVSLRLGRKQVSPPLRNSTTPLATEELAIQEEKKEEVQAQEIHAEEPVVIEQVRPTERAEEPAVVAEIDEPRVVEEQSDLPTGYYVVVGSFKFSNNASRYAGELREKGYPATVTYSAQKNYNYVHVGKFNTLEEARRTRDTYRSKSAFYFSDTWILFAKE